MPNNECLSDCIERLVDGQMELDKLMIAKDGNLYPAIRVDIEGDALKGWEIIKPFDDNEIITFDEYEKRVRNLVHEIVY